mmetsp:Transcript_21375/g.29746  ORF Transcript_21375/g.29746 Transcript_21375/m.29746 type:complete len:150 (-) Transcript_21375:474-923(-)
MTATPFGPDKEEALHQLVRRINSSSGGVRVILFSTSEGVPLGRIYAEDCGNLSEEVLASVESTWAPASKQFPLLGQGKEIKTVTAMYDVGNLIHVYQTPLVVTILTAPHANLGTIRSIALPILKELLDSLCQTLLSSLTPNTNAQDRMM